MSDPIKVLMFEDTAVDAELLLREMRKGGLEVVAERVDTREALEAALAETDPDIILSDYTVPGFDGIDALHLAQERNPHTPFIFVSGTIGEERAIDALRQGATDYVLKDNRARLVPAIRRALDEARERRARRAAVEAQRGSEERFRSVAEASQEWIWETDAQGTFVYSNPAATAILGYALGTLLGQRAIDYVCDEDRPSAVALWSGSDAARRGWRGRVLRWRAQDGGPRWLEGSGLPMLSAQGEVTGHRGACRDITERIHQEEKIERLSRIHAVLGAINSTLLRVRDRLELCRDACHIAVDRGGLRMAWIGLAENAAVTATPIAWAGHEDGFLRALAASHHGASGGDAAARSAEDLARLFVANDLAHDPRVALQKEALARGYRSMVSLPLRTEDQAVGALVLYAAEPDFFDQGEISLLQDVAADISLALTHIAREEKLAFISYYDPLTGLANRELFLDRLGQLLNSAQAKRHDAAVARVDLQRFRNINDTLGQGVGDEVLRQMAARLRKAFPEPATVARLGADQFAVAIGELGSSALAALLEAWIRQFAAEPFAVAALELRAAVKIGLALYPTDGATAETLFVNSEAALWRAKESTDAYAFYSPEMNQRVRHRLHLESRLRNAVLHNLFALHYQPKLDLASRRIRGVEALLRWNDAELGSVSPSEFIPVLEETGMIIDVGRWVIEQAAADAGAWQGRGLPVPRIAVNVSQAQLQHRDFVASVLAALGPAPHRDIDIEITESMLMKDAQQSAERLDALRACGMRVYIDDFGTGYCNLSQLAKLPVDALKIDHTFIARICTHEQDRALVTAIIGLAKAIDVVVVAEGVETEDQASLLRSLGCDEAQGHLFSRAIPADAVAALLGAAIP